MPYGYKEEALRSFVEEKLSKATKWERAAAREEGILEVELQRKAKVCKELQDEGGDDEDDEEGAESSRSRCSRSVHTRYAEKQDVRQYVEVLESVLTKNGYEIEYWHLVSPTSVLGTSLLGTMEGRATYDEAKKELLAEFSQLQEACWKALLTYCQGPETFHWYSSHILKGHGYM